MNITKIEADRLIYVTITATYPLASNINVDINFSGDAQDQVKDEWGQDQPEIVRIDEIITYTLNQGETEWVLKYDTRRDEVLQVTAEAVYMTPNSDSEYKYSFNESRLSWSK